MKTFLNAFRLVRNVSAVGLGVGVTGWAMVDSSKEDKPYSLKFRGMLNGYPVFHREYDNNAPEKPPRDYNPGVLPRS